MERKKLTNRIFSAIWVLLVLLILGFFFKDRISQLPAWLKKVKREPQALVRSFKPRNMAGFECSFQHPSDRELWKTNRTVLEVVSPPFDSPQKWARVTYYPSANPGLLWTDETMGLMDWRAAENFSFAVYNPQGWQVELKVKVKDEAGQVFQKNEILPPLRVKRVKIPVEQIAARLDASRINYLNLFLWEPATETVLYYTEFAFPSIAAPEVKNGFIRFMGLEFPPTVESGEEIAGSFYFLTRQKMNSDHHLLVRLRKGEEVFLLKEVHPPFPTSKWQVGRLIKVGPFPLTIPENLEEGTYELEAILAHPLRELAGLRYFFQPYENAGLKDFCVSEIRVTGKDGE